MARQWRIEYPGAFYHVLSRGNPFKPRADIVLVGKGHVPGGKATQVLDVMIRAGETRKILRLFGDRFWIPRTCRSEFQMSKPMFFETMDIVYRRAYGGIDGECGDFCRENIAGRGFVSRRTKRLAVGVPVPNVEDPACLIKCVDDRPKPAGFGFYNRACLPRAGYLGSYDEKWRKERSPGLPEDFRFDFYNAAHPDLQVKGYLKGDEKVELVHLTPEGKARFSLPGIELSCQAVVHLDSSSDYRKRDIALNLDTLCLIPESRSLFLVWRGLCPVEDMTGKEMAGVVVE